MKKFSRDQARLRWGIGVVGEQLRNRLHGGRLNLRVGRLLHELGNVDRDRIKKVLSLFENGNEDLSLSLCLNVLFADMPVKIQLNRFTKLRKAFNDAAVNAGVGVAFCVDRERQQTSNVRRCWFEAEATAALEAERFSRDGIADIERTPRQGEVHNRALAMTGGLLAGERDRRQKVRFFVCYAREYLDQSNELIERLRLKFEGFGKYVFESWGDWLIEIGTNWDESIKRALEDCDFGLLFLSDAFFASEYIQSVELPWLLSQKVVLPIALGTLPVGKGRLCGLETMQIFFHQPLQTKTRKAYIQHRNGRRQQDEFASSLFERIEQRLDSYVDQVATHVSPNSPSIRRVDDDFFRSLAIDPNEANLVPASGRQFQLRELERIDLDSSATQMVNFESHHPVEALSLLEQWVDNPNSPAFYALLGEYGIGKTTTLKQFTRRLLERRRSDPGSTLPIYVDLRNFIFSDELPTLHQILTEVVRRNWQSGVATPDEVPLLSALEIIDLVQKQGAVILFDGLDEKIVHLAPDRARAFIRELWRVLPPPRMKIHTSSELNTKQDKKRGEVASDAQRHRGKMVLSCRSHYFKDVWSQNAMLTNQDRGGILASDYQACILLPFREDQVREYLQGVFQDEAKTETTIELFRSVHNLTELSARPYLLSVMVDHIDELEQRKARGEVVLGVTVYEMVVRKWLERDGGKHQFSEVHKQELMEQLASDLWRDGEREWVWDRVERWLDQFLEKRPDIARRYLGRAPEVLNEDLRTATFVLRRDDSPDRFCFAHTSLQEFFLARYMLRALEEDSPDRWDLPMPSLETLDFLGQLLASRKSIRAIASWSRWLDEGVLRDRFIAFRLWLLAAKCGYPQPQPLAPDLSKLNLENCTIAGHDGSVIDLSCANLRASHLDHARVCWANLNRADFTGSSVRMAEFTDTVMNDAVMDGADCTGTRWRNCVAQRLNGVSARWHDSEWIHADLSNANLGSNFLREGSIAPVNADFFNISIQVRGKKRNRTRVQDAYYDAVLVSLTGHRQPTTSVAWSPNEKLIATGSDDFNVRLWDALSGRQLANFIGHENSISMVAWSPDGTRIASGSWDKSVRVWNTVSGNQIAICSGHKGQVLSVKWSPDGTRIVSGSEDKSLRVWDASNGGQLAVFVGHKGGITSVAWSPDGTQLVSGSRDKSLRVWNAQSGRQVEVYNGQYHWIHLVEWSSAKIQVISTADDNCVRIFDASNGRCVATLTGHEDSVSSVAWSPDRSRLVSGSLDKSIRIWDALNGYAAALHIQRKSPVTSVGWSPDGAMIVSGSENNNAEIWDASDGRHLASLAGYEVMFSAVHWSRDGKKIISASVDGTVHVWDASSGHCLEVHTDTDIRTFTDVSNSTTIGSRKIVNTGSTIEIRETRLSAVTETPNTSTGRRDKKRNATRLVGDDSRNEQVILSLHLLPQEEMATADHQLKRITWATPGAWRWLGWRINDPVTGRNRILPAETFGSLPGDSKAPDYFE